MLKLKQRIIWFLFLTNAFLILLISYGCKYDYFINLIRNYKELLKINSKYIIDSDYNLVHKKDIL